MELLSLKIPNFQARVRHNTSQNYNSSFRTVYIHFYIHKIKKGYSSSNLLLDKHAQTILVSIHFCMSLLLHISVPTLRSRNQDGSMRQAELPATASHTPPRTFCPPCPSQQVLGSGNVATKPRAPLGLVKHTRQSSSTRWKCCPEIKKNKNQRVSRDAVQSPTVVQLLSCSRLVTSTSYNLIKYLIS